MVREVRVDADPLWRRVDSVLLPPQDLPTGTERGRSERGAGDGFAGTFRARSPIASERVLTDLWRPDCGKPASRGLTAGGHDYL